MTEDDLNLIRLLHAGCAALQGSLVNRLTDGRQLTPNALKDLRRELNHLVSRVDIAIEEKAL